MQDTNGPNFVLAGNVRGGIDLVGIYGNYWAREAYDNGRAYGMYLSDSVVVPAYALNLKYRGFSVRCVVN